MRTKDSHGNKWTDLLFRGHDSVIGFKNVAGCQQDSRAAFCVAILVPTLVTWRHVRPHLNWLQLQVADGSGGLGIQVKVYLSNRDSFYLQHVLFSPFEGLNGLKQKAATPQNRADCSLVGRVGLLIYVNPKFIYSRRKLYHGSALFWKGAAGCLCRSLSV
jgi:hypothetical protein